MHDFVFFLVTFGGARRSIKCLRLDCAIDGELERTEISEEKYSALENSMKDYIDSSFLAGKNQQEQKEVCLLYTSTEWLI